MDNTRPVLDLLDAKHFYTGFWENSFDMTVGVFF